MSQSFGSVRATLVVLIFLGIGPLFGGLAFNMALGIVFGKIDAIIFRNSVYWVFAYAYGSLSALTVGGIVAAYGGERLRFRVVIIASLLVGVAFSAYMLRNDNFVSASIIFVLVFVAIHVFAGVTSLAVSKVLLRL